MTQVLEAVGRREDESRMTVVRWLTTTDHKRIGQLYLMSSGLFFAVGGVMALLIRAQVTAPGLTIVSPEIYNQLFTMHGSIMLLLYAMPFFTGIANVIMPVQIGAPDVAFPKLNAFAFWIFLFGALIVAGGLLTPQGPRTSAGPRTSRSPRRRSPRVWGTHSGSPASP